MRKKRILNLVMVLSILVVFAAGIMAVGSIKGWFREDASFEIRGEDGRTESVTAIVQKKLGTNRIERKGVSYSLAEGTKLRPGDIIETLNGSTLELLLGKNSLILDENSRVRLDVPDGNLTLTLEKGGLLALVSKPFSLQLMDQVVTMDEGVLLADAPYGSTNLRILGKKASIAGMPVTAGTAVSILPDGIQRGVLSIQSLNNFELDRIMKIQETYSLCFTGDELEKLHKERQNVYKVNMDLLELDPEHNQEIDEERLEYKQNPLDHKTGTTPTSSKLEEESPVESKEPSASETVKTDPATSPPETTKETQPPLQCTLTIRCDTILNNMGDLADGKDKYVPSNGVILAVSRLTFEDGETVFDVLRRVCKEAGIQLEYSWTPIYNSYYVEGINHLYEFDCGETSGWMYKVNGWFPNYGSSVYTLKDGDAIAWQYTCKGLGEDLGAPVY